MRERERERERERKRAPSGLVGLIFFFPLSPCSWNHINAGNCGGGGATGGSAWYANDIAVVGGGGEREREIY